MKNLVTKIDFALLTDYIKELQHRGIKRVFRDFAGGTISGNYTALSDDGQMYLIAEVTYPEGIELQRYLNPRYEPGNDNHYGHRHEVWNYAGEECYASTNGKKEFVDWLKRVQVDASVIKALRSTKISDLTTLIDESSTEDDTELSATYQEKRGRGETDLTVNLCNGLVTQLLMRVQKERHGNALNYALIIEDWLAVRDQMRHRNEQPFTAAGIEIVSGKIEIIAGKE